VGFDNCAGCLGSQKCWVCLGPGAVELRPGEVAPCVRCAGSGKCFVCQAIPQPIPIARPRRPWQRQLPAQRSNTSDAEAAS
jgi:hypothetical protein